MRIEIRVKPGAKKASIEERTNGTYLIKVKEQAIEGRANEAVIEALARHFSVPKNRVTIVRGRSSRVKIVNVIRE